MRIPSPVAVDPTPMETIAAEHGVAPGDLTRFLRAAAEIRLADDLTILRFVDQVENLAWNRNK